MLSPVSVSDHLPCIVIHIVLYFWAGWNQKSMFFHLPVAAPLPNQRKTKETTRIAPQGGGNHTLVGGRVPATLRGGAANPGSYMYIYIYIYIYVYIHIKSGRGFGTCFGMGICQNLLKVTTIAVKRCPSSKLFPGQLGLAP